MTRLPVNKLKPDIGHAHSVCDLSCHAFAAMSLVQARVLNVNLIGRGVDCAHSYENLVDLVCHAVQGHHRMPPMLQG